MPLLFLPPPAVDDTASPSQRIPAQDSALSQPTSQTAQIAGTLCPPTGLSLPVSGQIDSDSTSNIIAAGGQQFDANPETEHVSDAASADANESIATDLAREVDEIYEIIQAGAASSSLDADTDEQQQHWKVGDTPIIEQSPAAPYPAAPAATAASGTLHLVSGGSHVTLPLASEGSGQLLPAAAPDASASTADEATHVGALATPDETCTLHSSSATDQSTSDPAEASHHTGKMHRQQQTLADSNTGADVSSQGVPAQADATADSLEAMAQQPSWALVVFVGGVLAYRLWHARNAWMRRWRR